MALLRRAERIIHAGDIVAAQALGELLALGPPLSIVAGNCDPPELGLPETAELTHAGLRIAVLHDAGPAVGRLVRMRARFPRAQLVIFGHSHIPLIERGAGGFRIFNPGSATQRRRQPEHTMGVLDGDSLTTITL